MARAQRHGGWLRLRLQKRPAKRAAASFFYFSRRLRPIFPFLTMASVTHSVDKSRIDSLSLPADDVAAGDDMRGPCGKPRRCEISLILCFGMDC